MQELILYCQVVYGAVVGILFAYAVISGNYLLAILSPAWPLFYLKIIYKEVLKYDPS
jgi:hypothetical protein